MIAKKWRRINPYRCRICGKKRNSFKYERSKNGVCTVCRKNSVPDNQPQLFPAEQNIWEKQ